MTKKIFAMFLAVLMVVSMLPTSVFAASCPGKGSDKHTLENCTYTVVKVTDPTCGTKGFTTYMCSVCGDYFTENWVDATGEHELIELPALAPTCAKPGYEAGVQCVNCSYKVEGPAIAPLGKDGTTECEWVDKTPHINCEVGGTKIYECVACGAVYTEEIKAGEHTWKKCSPVVEDGKAYVVCGVCGETKEVDYIEGHDCVWMYRDRVEPTCFEEGVMAHRECRICGQLQINYEHEYYGWGWYNVENVVLSRTHHFDCPASCQFVDEHNGNHKATCVDAELHCNVCDGYFDVSEEHVYTVWNVAEDGQPTCTRPGYEISYCDNCKIARTTRILKKLDHLDVTITVPATCYTYAYTYTVCLREGCDREYTVRIPDEILDTTDYSMLIEQYAPITDWANNDILGGGFYLASEQNKVGYVTYFNGTMVDNYYLGVTHDVTEAVKVYVEIVHPLLENAYRLYFINEDGVKTYIEIYENWSNGKLYGNVRLTTTKPDTYYELDAEKNVLTASFEQENGSVNTYFLNNYNKNTRLGASLIKYWPYKASSTTYAAYLCQTGVYGEEHIINATFDIEAGFNENNHAYEAVYGEIDETDCTAEGYYWLQCPNCDAEPVKVDTVTGHTWSYYAEGEFVEVNGKLIPAVKTDDPCEGGYRYKQCTVCLLIQKEEIPAWGHWWGDLIEETPDHLNPVVYDHYECLCGDTLNVERKTWNSNNKFDSEGAAQKAHSYSNLVDWKYNAVRTSCTTKLYDRATCEDCGKAVYIWIEGTGDHTLKENTPGYVAPQCLIPGGYFTYNCEVCDAVIGDAALGEWNVLPATGHSWKENESYKAADHNSPNFVEQWVEINGEKYPVFDKYGPFTHYCENCEIGLTDGTEYLCQATVGRYQDLCTEGTFLYYICWCGEEHIYNYVAPLGHKQVELDRYEKNADGTFKKDANGQLIIIAANYQPATCTSAGWYKTQCVYCGNVEKVVIPVLPHVNAAGETFWNKCTDTVTDRHCVNCCACANEGAAHKCDATTDKDGNKRDVCACVIPTDCNYIHSDNHGSTCVQDAYTLKICGDCGTHTMIPWADSEWNGHRPVTNYEWYKEIQVVDEDGNPVIGEDGFYVYETIKLDVAEPMFLDNYVYRTYKWISVKTDAEDNFYNDDSHPEYMAKFIEYVDPTYTSEGYWVGMCADCGQIVTQKIDKLSGLGFEVDVFNANGVAMNAWGIAEGTFGSEIEVILYANSNGEGIYSFDLNLDYDSDVLFVGYEEMNDDFQFAVTSPENAAGKVNIMAYAVHSASGNMQNIAINARTPLIKLVFRSLNEEASYQYFTVNEEEAKAYKYDANYGPVEFECHKDSWLIINRGLLNFNNDLKGDIVDMLQAMTMLTGEHPYGKTYDVTVDVNKDGEITLEEISIGYNKLVNNYTSWDLFFMGMDAAEVAQIMELLGIHAYAHNCVNDKCEYGSDYAFVICPWCFTIQANG